MQQVRAVGGDGNQYRSLAAAIAQKFGGLGCVDCRIDDFDFKEFAGGLQEFVGGE